MTTSEIDAAAWSQTTQAASPDVASGTQGPSWGVALIGVGVVLNLGWIALVAFVAAKLTIL